MANIIKNFGLEGVGSSVQFGKGGARLVQADGQFSAKDASNGSFVRFAIANAVSGSDAVTLEQMNAAVLAVSGDNDALDLKIDEVIASVGLEADGSIQLAAGNYLADADTVVDALGALDAAVKAEADARVLALSAEANARADADAALSGRADVLEANAVAQQAAIDALQLAVGDDSRLDALEGRTDALEGEMDAVEGRALALEGNVALLQGEVDAVEVRATALEGRATALEGNVATLAADLAALDDAAIKKDGSVAFTGNQALGGFKLTGVGAPTANGDAANKQYVDGIVANLGNAFNYVGTLNGGEDEASAFDIATLPEGGKDAGDYYKVIEAGYIKLGSEVVFFHVNDGLVLNSAGGFDKIDNTDSVSRGTVGQIVVSGSTDTGFDISIDAAYTAARQLEVSNEANARALAVAGLEANAVAQQSAIDAVEARADALETGVAALEANAVAQQAAIDALEAAVGDDSRVDALEANAVAQQAAIDALAAEDVALDGRLDVLEANAVAQQSAIDALAGDLQNLSQDTLTSAGEIYTVHAADTHAEIAADGSSTKLEVTVASGEVVLSAADEGDADLRLVAAGAGSVVIGEAGDGFLQAEDGFNMTVAGGDNGGELTLKGSVVNVESDNGSLVIDGSSIAAAGADADIDLVFSAKGAGSIDMSGAQVVNIANAVSEQDAVAFAQMRDAIIEAEHSHVKVAQGYFAFHNGTSPNAFATGRDGYLMSMRIIVTQAFVGAGTAQIVMDDQNLGSNYSLANSNTDFDLSVPGVYIVELGAQHIVAADIKTVVSGFTDGYASVFVDYMQR